MVLQVFSNLRFIGYGFYFGFSQVIRGADTGELQKLRGLKELP